MLLYLFGASPALCPSFVAGRPHALKPLGDGKRALYLPHATSLRMGRLGYQSDAQATLAVSYNGLEGYADSLHEALTRPYPAYEQIGIRNPGGEYNQLGTSLLQIENEFYGTIRPKRTTRSGERPLHALRERGVEYVEVRLMDLNPFESVGITADTMRVLDVFLLHCLYSDSPPDTPEEIAELKNNQHLTAERGREPGLELVKQGRKIALADWGRQVLDECQPIAAALDAAEGSHAHADALRAARALFDAPENTPSAHVLRELSAQFDNNFIAFTRAHSQAAREELMNRPWSQEQQQRYVDMSAKSVAAQRAIEDADDMPFEAWRERYMSVEQLG
ncbi:Glutamate--cysteine ligase [bioreactor metagenome]|uniref:glutamate--cysteine ligase n=1 Tax=bioreactor metagenome TaxID=1076179 RepID=A0A645E096_9ZZZZ